ncbi:MAG: hypothetical protein ACRD2B_15010 [Terriglobia bacterium]
MARIRKWQEALVVALAAMFFSVSRAWPLGMREAASPDRPTYTRLVTGMAGKTAFGIELGARRPYVRLFRAALAPMAVPVAAGAFVAMAGAAPDPSPAGSPNSSCALTCNASTATCCSHADGDPCCDHHCTRNCTRVTCTNIFSGTRHCVTCGHGTCTCEP